MANSRGRMAADDSIASLLQEMGQKQGYSKKEKGKEGDSGSNDDGAEECEAASHENSHENQQQQERVSFPRQIRELTNYPENNYKAGSHSIWNPLVQGDGDSFGYTFGSKSRSDKASSQTSHPLLFLPTNPQIEVIRRRVFEKFRQQVQTVLQDFQSKFLSKALEACTGSSGGSTANSGSFSKNRHKLPIPSMIEKWHFDAKLEEHNYLLQKVTNDGASGTPSFSSSMLSSTTDILRERTWRRQPSAHNNNKPILPTYDPILLNKQAPRIFVETILTPHVQKAWQQSTSTKDNPPPLPPKYNKRATQIQKALYKLVCEALDSFDTQLAKGAREEAERSSSSSGQKRPRISMGQGGNGDDPSLSSLVRVTYSGVTLKLHRAYLEKLQRLYDRAKDKHYNNEEQIRLRPYHNLSFEEALFCLLCRYDMIQGAGLQAGVPGSIMDVLLDKFGCRFECFASPLNCRYDSFASAFGDVDVAFGSQGSFFELPSLMEIDNEESDTNDDLQPICYEANPPFCDGLILQLDDKITKVLSSQQRNQRPIMFVVFVPAWKDSKCYQALLENQHLVKHVFLPQGEHWYAEGTQHRRKESFRVASFDTSIFFYQNNAAKVFWHLQSSNNDENSIVRALRSAFTDPGTMEKDQGSTNQRPSPSRTNILPTKTAAVAVATSVPNRQTTPSSRDATKSITKESKPKKKVAKDKKKRQWNTTKEEGNAQLALLESLGLSSVTTSTTNVKQTSSSTKTKKKKKRRKK